MSQVSLKCESQIWRCIGGVYTPPLDECFYALRYARICDARPMPGAMRIAPAILPRDRVWDVPRYWTRIWYATHARAYCMHLVARAPSRGGYSVMGEARLPDER